MSKFIIALNVLAFIAVTLTMPDQAKSDDYKHGYAQGRMDGFIASTGIDGFHRCLKFSPEKTPDQCWAEQIKAMSELNNQWLGMSEQERANYFDSPESKRWVDNLTGKGNPKDLPRFLR